MKRETRGKNYIFLYFWVLREIFGTASRELPQFLGAEFEAKSGIFEAKRQENIGMGFVFLLFFSPFEFTSLKQMTQTNNHNNKNLKTPTHTTKKTKDKKTYDKWL